MDQSGQKRSKHVLSVESFQFLDSKSSDSGYETGNDGDFDGGKEVGYSKPANSAAARTPEIDIQDDEIPF